MKQKYTLMLTTTDLVNCLLTHWENMHTYALSHPCTCPFACIRSQIQQSLPWIQSLINFLQKLASLLIQIHLWVCGFVSMCGCLFYLQRSLRRAGSSLSQTKAFLLNCTAWLILTDSSDFSSGLECEKWLSGCTGLRCDLLIAYALPSA